MSEIWLTLTLVLVTVVDIGVYWRLKRRIADLERCVGALGTLALRASREREKVAMNDRDRRREEEATLAQLVETALDDERREQLEMMLQWREGLIAVEDRAIEAISEALSKATNYSLSPYGADEVRKLLRKFSVVEVLDALEAAIRQYIERDEAGNVLQDSVNLTLSKLPGFLHLRNQPDDIRQLYYIRGIMRRRFNYCPEWKAIKLLKAAYEAGASPDELHALANEWGVTE